MLVHAWLALVGIGVLTTGAAIGKRASVFSAGASIPVWLVAAYGALNIEVPVDGTDPVTFNEPGLAVLALVPGLLCVALFYLALVGRWNRENDPDPLADATGGRITDPRNP